MPVKKSLKIPKG